MAFILKHMIVKLRAWYLFLHLALKSVPGLTCSIVATQSFTKLDSLTVVLGTAQLHVIQPVAAGGCPTLSVNLPFDEELSCYCCSVLAHGLLNRFLLLIISKTLSRPAAYLRCHEIISLVFWHYINSIWRRFKLCWADYQVFYYVAGRTFLSTSPLSLIMKDVANAVLRGCV